MKLKLINSRKPNSRGGNNNWMQNVKSDGSTRKRLGVKKNEKVTIPMLNKDIAKQQAKKKNGKLSASALKSLRQDVAAKNMIKSNKGRKN